MRARNGFPSTKQISGVPVGVSCSWPLTWGSLDSPGGGGSPGCHGNSGTASSVPPFSYVMFCPSQSSTWLPSALCLILLSAQSGGEGGTPGEEEGLQAAEAGPDMGWETLPL